MTAIIPSAQITAKYRTADEWAALGIKVQKTSGDLPRTERETGLSFIDSEKDCEVNTCRPAWMRRLERDGAIPESIQIYEEGDGEFRWYVIPKAWVKMPYKPVEASAKQSCNP